MILTADIKLCRKSYFTYKEFYEVIDCFMFNKDLTVTNIYGEGTIIKYRFEMEKERVYLNFDSKYEILTLELEVDASIESFVDYVKELEFQVKDRFLKKNE